mgnify:CR=1 FL=1
MRLDYLWKFKITLINYLNNNEKISFLIKLTTLEGKIHQPTFIYKCILGSEFVEYGKGSNKKKAKHAAAYAILNRIIENNRGINDSLVQTLQNLV